MFKHYSYLLIILISLSIISCSSPKNNEALLIEAEALIQKGDISEAVINLKNILQDDPNQYQARFLLGSAYLSVDDYSSAEKEFERSLSGDPENNKAIIMLARTHLNLNKFSNAIQALEKLKLTNIEDEVYSLFILGQAYIGLDDVNLAKEKFNKANTLDSTSLHSIMGNAILAAYENNTEEALILINKLLSQDESYTQALLLKGSIYSKQNEHLLAAQAYESYYKLRPNNTGLRTLVAHNYIRAGSYDLAKPHIDALRKENDNNPTVNTLAAQLKYADKDYEAAKELADSVVNATDNGLAQMISGLSSFQLENYEQAYYQLNAIEERLPKGHQVHKILAVLQVKLGYTDELQETLGHFSELSTADATIFANLGLEFVNQGDQKSALDMLNKASLLAPKDESIQTHLGVFKLLNNDDSGLSNLKEAIALNPNSQGANLALAMNYLNTGEKNKAKEVADQWIKNSPENISALLLRGNVALKSDDIEGAISYFMKAKEIDPTNLVSIFNLAVIASDQKNYNRSNSYLDEIFSIDLEYPYAYRLAISNALQLDKQEELKTKLRSIIADNPKALWPRIILARKLVVEKHYQEAIALLEISKSYETLSTPYLVTLSNALLASKQYQALSNMYAQWQREQPKNISAYLNYIDILDKRKSYSDALDVVKKGLAQEGLSSNFQLLALEPYYLLATEQGELASNKINRLAALHPNNAFILRVQGQTALFQEDYSSAVSYLSQSYKLNKKIPVGIFLVTAYKKTNQHQQAINFLNSELKASPNIDIYKKSLAELYVNSSPDKAVEHYKDLLKSHPNDIVILNNLAWTLFQQENLESAYFYAAQAKELSPKHPGILDTYALILIKQNKLPQAIESLELAHSIAPKNTEIKEHLVNAYMDNNQQEKANNLLENKTL